MIKDVLNRLNTSINRFEQREYDENEFHSTLESVIPLITEYDLHKLREFLSEKEGDLEVIDFTINEEGRRDEYMKVLLKIKDYLINNSE